MSSEQSFIYYYFFAYDEIRYFLISLSLDDLQFRKAFIDSGLCNIKQLFYIVHADHSKLEGPIGLHWNSLSTSIQLPIEARLTEHCIINRVYHLPFALLPAVQTHLRVQIDIRPLPLPRQVRFEAVSLELLLTSFGSELAGRDGHPDFKVSHEVVSLFGHSADGPP